MKELKYFVHCGHVKQWELAFSPFEHLVLLAFWSIQDFVNWTFSLLSIWSIKLFINWSFKHLNFLALIHPYLIGIRLEQLVSWAPNMPIITILGKLLASAKARTRKCAPSLLVSQCWRMHQCTMTPSCWIFGSKYKVGDYRSATALPRDWLGTTNYQFRDNHCRTYSWQNTQVQNAQTAKRDRRFREVCGYVVLLHFCLCAERQRQGSELTNRPISSATGKLWAELWQP